jgi:hypothetical protein
LPGACTREIAGGRRSTTNHRESVCPVEIGGREKGGRGINKQVVIENLSPVEKTRSRQKVRGHHRKSPKVFVANMGG